MFTLKNCVHFDVLSYVVRALASGVVKKCYCLTHLKLLFLFLHITLHYTLHHMFYFIIQYIKIIFTAH